MDHAIQAEGLVKTFMETKALAGVDLVARTGTVLGVLGPNGAGKTTVVRILATLLKPDAGRALVGGLDVVRQAGAVRARIGLTGQYAAVDEMLTGAENLLTCPPATTARRGPRRPRTPTSGRAVCARASPAVPSSSRRRRAGCGAGAVPSGCRR
jgi:ABC-type uncharacterized transport system ATPase subunit